MSAPMSRLPQKPTSREEAVAGLPADDWRPFAASLGRPQAAPDPRKEHELALQNAVRHARAAAQADAAAALARAAREHEHALAERLDAQRRQLVEEQSCRIADLVAARFDEARAEIGAAIARMLKPVIEDRLRDMAIREAVAATYRAIGERAAVEIAVSGPPDLVGRITAQLEARAIPVAVSATPGIDVRIRVDRTIIETGMGDWLATLGGASR